MEAKVKQLLKTIKLNESMLSVIFGMITVVLIGILVFRMYQGNKPEITSDADTTSVPQATETVGEVAVEVKETGEKFVVDQPETYTVQTGDHLWMIAEQVYGSGYNWVDIAKENELVNPSVVTSGQILRLPKVAVREIVKPATATISPEMPKIEGDSYTVVKGDNLWNICVRAYSDGYKWTEVSKFNQLVNASLIEVGQVIKLPR